MHICIQEKLTCFLRADWESRCHTPAAAPTRKISRVTHAKNNHQGREQGSQQRATINHAHGHTLNTASRAKAPDSCWRCHCSRRGDWFMSVAVVAAVCRKWRQREKSEPQQEPWFCRVPRGPESNSNLPHTAGCRTLRCGWRAWKAWFKLLRRGAGVAPAIGRPESRERVSLQFTVAPLAGYGCVFVLWFRGSHVGVLGFPRATQWIMDTESERLLAQMELIDSEQQSWSVNWRRWSVCSTTELVQVRNSWIAHTGSSSEEPLPGNDV